MRAHVIKNGKIANTIVVDSLSFCPGLIDASVGGAIGDGWDGAKITPAPPAASDTPKDKTDLIIAALIAKGGYSENDFKPK